MSDKKLTKRETDGEFYPDWVPFKNKKGEELGEFVQVKKKKPAKRLALPVNFVLRPVADTEGDDYYEKGQGDGEDYYEKKEWSDQYRSAKNAAPVKTVVKTTDVAEVEGIVNIPIVDKRPITETETTSTTESESPVISGEVNEVPKKIAEDILFDINKEYSEAKTDSNEGKVKNKEEKQENNKDESEVGLILPAEDPEIKKEIAAEDTSVGKRAKEYNDYEEESAEKAKPEQTEEEKQKAEAKKQHILGLVDDLKRRHEKEQREISERAKEEEIIKEERERELSRGRITLQSNEADEGYDKYNNKNYNKDRSKPTYEDYEENPNVDDKYKIHPPTKKRPPVTTTIAPVTSTVKAIVRTPKRKRTKTQPNKHRESGKLSVFKNPKLYMIYDDDTIAEETSTVNSSTKTPKKSARKSYTIPTTTSTTSTTSAALLTSNDFNESVRISLVPENNEMKDGEPTLFFPQKRKNKRKRKNRTRSSTPEPDSHVAESVNGFAKDVMNGTEATAPQSTLETTAVLPPGEAIVTGPTASAVLEESIESTRAEDSSPLAAAPSSAVSDALASASGHAEPKHKNYHLEKGKSNFLNF